MKKHAVSPVRVIAPVFLAIILVGALLLSLPVSARSGTRTSFVDSLFTAASATCVTGLSVFDTYTHWSLFGQTVLLVLIQIGGLGFMTVFTLVSLMIRRNINIRERKVLMQSVGAEQMGGIIRLTRRIAAGTLFFETLGALLLSFRFCADFGFKKGIYFSLFHSVSAFCNAGFDLMGAVSPGGSLTVYRSSPLVLCTLMFLISVGGLGFFVWNDLARARFSWKKCNLHTKIVCTASVALFAGGTLLFLLTERTHALRGMPVWEKLLNAMFLAVTPRTAGFFTVDCSSLSESGALLTMLLMFIGGSPGSTAGGVKTTTAAVLLLALVSAVRGSDATVAFKRQIHPDCVRTATAVNCIYLIVNLAAAGLLCALQSFSLKDSLFEAVSATGTVGLTCGVTPLLGTPAKLLIALLMYMGRIGLLSLAAGIGQKKSAFASQRPVETVMIG